MSELRDYTLAEMDREDLEKMVFDLQNLIEIALSLSSNLEFDSLVESLLYICIGQMLVDKVVLFLHVNFENEDLSFYMTRGYTVDPETKINEKSQLLNHFRSNWKIINSAQAKELMAEDPYTSELYSLLAPEIVIPLRSKNTLNGLIFMSKKIMDTPYTEQEFLFLDKLSKFASIAVENSRLYRMATLDRMTGLFIHHYFQERLAEEIKRAERMNNPLTLLMADLDHFKDVNDTHGHPQGDIILKGTENIIHQNIRSFDIPSRYGGEEFAIILADTDITAAEHIAERLRKRVEETAYKIDSGEIRITISIGIAQFDPEIDMTSNDLVKRADEALYSAKAHGRNRVVRAEDL